MYIDKEDMELAYYERSNPDQYNKLLDYFDQMTDYFTRRLKVKNSLKDDYKQEALIHAVNSIEKYDPSKQSTAFSYFYKVIYMAFLYQLRKTKNKNDRRVKTCSLDIYDNIQNEDAFKYDEFEDLNDFFMIGQESFSNHDIQNRIKEAKKHARKLLKIPSTKSRNHQINQIQDVLVRKIVSELILKKIEKV